jgi:hypothetical protein
MGRVFRVNLGGSVSAAGEARGILGRGHTGRSVPVDADYAVAREWFEAGDFAAIVSHPAAARFREEMQAVSLATGTTTCVRGRPDDGTIHGWRDMGPPPAATRNNRYNRIGDFAFYLCDSDTGVFREVASPTGKVFLQDYQIPFDQLRVADLCDERLSDFMRAVFDFAETCGFVERGGSDDLSFSQAVAHLVREMSFDGMLVPGVRGEKGHHYRNVVLLGAHSWEEWSLRENGFHSHHTHASS